MTEEQNFKDELAREATEDVLLESELSDESPIKKLDAQFETWVTTILDWLNDGGRLVLHKTHDYVLYPEFFPNEMKFKAKRMSDDFEGRVYVTIYEIEHLYDYVVKMSRETKVKKIKEKLKPVAPVSDNKETPNKGIAVIKLIKSFITDNPGCSYEDIEAAYIKNGIVLKSMSFGDYLKSLKSDGDKFKKFTITVDENKYYFKLN